MPPVVRKLPDAFKTYEDGKHRRYTLLFSVNGGALAIAKLLPSSETERFLGGLSLQHIAIGMIVFTLLMLIDIFAFGTHMRSTVTSGTQESHCEYVEMFGPVGRTVLVLLSVLICSAWWLAAFPGGRA